MKQLQVWDLVFEEDKRPTPQDNEAFEAHIRKDIDAQLELFAILETSKSRSLEISNQARKCGTSLA